MGEINRRNFIKNVAIGGAALGFGNAVFSKPPMALASEKSEEKESSIKEVKSEIIAPCHCKKVVLKLINLDTRFTVCHCDTCQLMHNGPWYGANCSDIKVINGKEYVNGFTKEYKEGEKTCSLPKGMKTWQFCSNCGSRLYYSFNDKISKNFNDKFNVSLGLIHSTYGKDLIMENETFFDVKPKYYSFHETKKFSSGDLIKHFNKLIDHSNSKGV
ncbi:MAG: twin-arginine translocation signal domain-containing protein [Desulfarculaceae bacterium]|nr:twin-arginine translocation signal domain-containing protein [Desulfarculaceae bacterium]MCF8047303.1 twin-arginine translocation signal domain-containing protein [Desulfarculaceae bacterium]MCF8066909.1 twin-arginine translocation signal domain-containing protein [Desulfarculaceae bacterium]MCF8098560.1 twin-arginine translocation signal domain-containing protein [Desulfarculaceae bacterium]MCF8121729.1 twin-arginine translocation signal domain-containing protein [Desulfarculaceae bacterium